MPASIDRRSSYTAADAFAFGIACRLGTGITEVWKYISNDPESSARPSKQTKNGTWRHVARAASYQNPTGGGTIPVPPPSSGALSSSWSALSDMLEPSVGAAPARAKCGRNNDTRYIIGNEVP